MITQIFKNTTNSKPQACLVLILSCLIVSVPTYFFPELYYVFSGTKQKYYLWQYITLFFEHGSYSLPLQLHLICNLTVIISCGILSEKVIGTKKLLILTGSSLFFNGVILASNGFYGNGISGVIWSYTSITAYILYLLYKDNISKFKQDKIIYVYLVLIFIFWVAITLADFIRFNGLSLSIITHSVSVLVGFVYVLINKNSIKNNIKYILNKPKNGEDVKSNFVKLLYVLPMSLLILLILFFTGTLNNHVSSTEVLSIMQDTIVTKNNSFEQVTIKFSGPMKMNCDNSSLYTISETDNETSLSKELVWINNKTLLVNFNRVINNNEQVKLVLKGMTDANRLILKKDIVVEINVSK